MISFNSKLTEALDDHCDEFYYRVVHANGMGLMNNQAINYDRLSDREYFKVEEGFLTLQQPRNVPAGALFAFTPDGMREHRTLIKLLKKASKYGVRTIRLRTANYEVIWESNDGQVAVVKKNRGKIETGASS